MAKLRLYAAGIAATFMILLTAAAADDAVLLKQAQEIFRPLPKNMGSAEFPITRERVELGRSLFFDPRLTIDASMSCSSSPAGVLRNGCATKTNRCQATCASAARPDQPQRSMTAFSSG